MDRNDKGNSMLRENVELGRILLVVVDDKSLLHLAPMLERFKYNVTICTGVKTAISLLKMNKSGSYIILIDGNLPNHMDQFQLLQNFLHGNDGMINFPVIMISSNGIIHSDYHYLASTVVMSVLELVGKHLSNVVQHQREEEHHDEGIKTLKSKKGDEHDQGKISWKGELEEAFVKSVNEISLHGKATGKQVRDSLRGKGFSNVDLKQVNSHLQKHRNKLKKFEGHVGGSSSGQVSSRYGRQENLYESDAPFFSTVDGDLSTTHPKHHLHVDNIQSIIEGSTLGGYQSSSLMTNGGQSSDLFVNDIQGEALDEDVTVMVGNGSACHPSSDYYRMDTPTDTLYGDFSFYIPSLGESSSVEDIAQQQYSYYINGR